MLYIVFMVLAFAVLLVGICFAVVAGAVQTMSVNSYDDANFAKIRLQVQKTDPDICPASIDDDACKTAIKDSTEAGFQTLALVLSFVCLFYIALLIFTYEAIKIYKDDPHGINKLIENSDNPIHAGDDVGGDEAAGPEEKAEVVQQEVDADAPDQTPDENENKAETDE